MMKPAYIHRPSRKEPPSFSCEDNVKTRFCKQCNVAIPDDVVHAYPRVKYCCRVCRLKSQKEGYGRKNAQYLKTRLGLSTATVGAISELRVATDLLSKGFAVFRALSPSCPCDLAILKNGVLIRVEVKTAHYSNTGKPYEVKRDITKSDVLARVLPETIIYTPSLEAELEGKP